MKQALQITLALLASLLILFTACSKKGQGHSSGGRRPRNACCDSQGARHASAVLEGLRLKPEHGEDGFALKVKITDKRGTEHFWAIDIERANDKIMGTINNDPDIVASVKLGDRIQIPEADISDWLYMREDKMVGNETLRPLLKKMPAKEAEQLKSIMANP